MTTPSDPRAPGAVCANLVSPVVDYEPPPVGMSACRSAPVLRRRAPRPHRPGSNTVVREADPPHAAVAFADAAVRRVLEVIDRRRPVAQLRPLLAPGLIDTVVGLSRSSQRSTSRSKGGTVARLRRLRVRMVDGSDGAQAEVFGTYTSGPRLRAFAARIELDASRWRIVALQIG
ncbi:hypothetical protein H7J93_08010 [Mycobacterium barrassiae]|uniref:Rv3235 family protein n=1 Tax=Mycobacterium barrassiae TaxID=319709 RepID=UPI0022658650|nr:Rv3235 family protein [Mycobacterium barrassiae]MCV7299576.1 hypothetical protein [Mycobacterium barrassiae]